MNNSPKKPALALVAATGAILFLGTTSAQAYPAPAGHHTASRTPVIQAGTPLTGTSVGQMGRSRILWCL